MARKPTAPGSRGERARRGKTSLTGGGVGLEKGGISMVELNPGREPDEDDDWEDEEWDEEDEEDDEEDEWDEDWEDEDDELDDEDEEDEW
jgi:hypothetical protein